MPPPDIPSSTQAAPPLTAANVRWEHIVTGTGSPQEAPLDLLQEYRRTVGVHVTVMLFVAPLLAVIALFGGGGSAQVALYLGLTVVAACMYGLYRKSRYMVAVYLLIAALIVLTATSVWLNGSIRGVGVIGFIVAIVVAGVYVSRNTLALVVMICCALLSALFYAEWTGLIGRTDFSVNARTLSAYLIVMAGLGIAIYQGRHLLLRALLSYRQELARREKAEHDLELSEERFARIFRNSPAAMLIADASSQRIIDVNAAFTRIFGLRRDEVIGSDERRLWAEPEAVRQQRDQLLRRGGTATFVACGRRADGGTFSASVSCEKEGDDPDALVISIIADISVEERSREALRKSEERFSKAFSFLPVPMVITRLSDGHYIETNAAMEKLVGYSREELLNRSTIETDTWISTEQRNNFVSHLKTDGRILGMEVKIQDSRGEIIDARVFAEIIEIDGEDCVLSCALNISEEKRRETLWMEAAHGLSGHTGEAFFAPLVLHLARAIHADLVLVGEVDQDRMVDTLAVTLDGKPVPNLRYPLTGMPCDQTQVKPGLFIVPREMNQHFPEIAALIGPDFEAYIGIALNDADGTPVGVLSCLWRSPIEPNSELQSLLTVFASRASAELVRLYRDREIRKLGDTLEQRVLERTRQLAAANEELDSFAYSVAHDLKSPLRAIDGFSRILSEQLGSRLNADEGELFQRVINATERMSQLISDLLGLARISQTAMTFTDGIDLSGMAREVIRHMRQADPDREIDVHIDDGLTARCDGKLARIVLENLLSNAWKYSRPKPRSEIHFGALPRRAEGEPDRKSVV